MSLFALRAPKFKLATAVLCVSHVCIMAHGTAMARFGCLFCRTDWHIALGLQTHTVATQSIGMQQTQITHNRPLVSKRSIIISGGHCLRTYQHKVRVVASRTGPKLTEAMCVHPKFLCIDRHYGQSPPNACSLNIAPAYWTASLACTH